MFLRFLSCLVAALIAGSVPGPAPAQPLFGLCKEADAQCRALATEVEKVRLTSPLGTRRPSFDPGNLLCTVDNPNCCPPEMMPVCSAHADVMIGHAITTLARSARKEGCPWSKEVCEGFGSFYCEKDQSWNPWFGCHDSLVVTEPPEPPTWVCPPGQRPGKKPKICEPIPCFHPLLNVEIPCGPDFPEVTFRDFTLPDGAERTADDPVGNLLRLMQEERVKAEAARAVATEFGDAFRAIRSDVGPYLD